MGRLTDRAAKTASAGRHGDGDGLQLVVSESGRRKWVLRYQMNGVRRDMGLGVYPAVSLSGARIAAADARKLMAQNVDPLDARTASRKAEKPIPTFGDIAHIVIEEAQRKSTNAKVRYQWERHLGIPYCAPLLSARRERDHDIGCRRGFETGLERETGGRTQTLSRHPTRIRVRANSPARRSWRRHAGQPRMLGHLKAMGFELPTKLSRGRHPSLPHERLPSFIADLRARNATAARALEFLILTNIRTDAVLKTRWDELDLDQALWAVPLANLKDRKYRKEAFRVPLSPRAVEIAREWKLSNSRTTFSPAKARTNLCPTWRY